MESNSNNFNDASFNTEGGDINVRIGNTTMLPSPKVVFSHNKFIEILDIIDFKLDTPTSTTQTDLTRVDMNRKNELNCVDKTYYEQIICENLKENFDEIDSILSSVKLRRVKARYNRVAQELNQSYLADRGRFPSLQLHIEYAREMMYNKHEEALDEHEKDMVSLILHHMYFKCLYGEKPEVIK